MHIEQHITTARRIENSLQKCGPEDYEIKIEAAMLAGTHWLNVALHRRDVNPVSKDVFHTYLLTINEFRRLSVADAELVNALADIENIRPPFVRGSWAGGEQAAERALALLRSIRNKALAEG
ncbi:hypothetical protein [Hydrogenophaga sp. 2FB]|uniref:hypothetical protein n=1 Tax=Hydrogenophaga sp. 2FB TaxID=2502187 RepID=UPI0010F47C0A|nr:hypothetical protein [Hydrogenophaga sp. 2FB]